MLVSVITRPLVVSVRTLERAVNMYRKGGYITVDGVPMTVQRLDAMLRHYPGESVYLYQPGNPDWVAVLTSHPYP